MIILSVCSASKRNARPIVLPRTSKDALGFLNLLKLSLSYVLGLEGSRIGRKRSPGVEIRWLIFAVLVE
jgi:hypothetical protein